MDNRKREIYEKSKMQTNTIKIAAASPQLKDKIRSNITYGTDTIIWYIRFNAELDATTVSRKTMSVTERNGYIVKTDITYDEKNKMIAILPIDCYAQNEYYLLQISKKVKSQLGTNLKKEINVMFKLLGNQISEFKVLSQSAKVPEPKKRPKGYVPNGAVYYPSAAKTYTFDQTKFDNLPKDRLPYDMIKLNPLIAVLGLIVLAAGLVLSHLTVMAAGLVLSAAGVLHVVIQFMQKKLRSIMSYNIGVLHFNKGNYAKANQQFIKAFKMDENNEYAEYAANKVSFYL